MTTWKHSSVKIIVIMIGLHIIKKKRGERKTVLCKKNYLFKSLVDKIAKHLSPHVDRRQDTLLRQPHQRIPLLNSCK